MTGSPVAGVSLSFLKICECYAPTRQAKVVLRGLRQTLKQGSCVDGQPQKLPYVPLNCTVWCVGFRSVRCVVTTCAHALKMMTDCLVEHNVEA